MNGITEVVRRIVADLGATGARFALVGGLAVSARTEPRFTRDVDFAVAVDGDREAEDVAGALQARGWRLTRLLEQQERGRIASVRLESADPSLQGHVVDLLLASCGIEGEVVAGATPLRITGELVVATAAAADLIAMKVLSRDDDRRPQDLLDLKALIAGAGTEELETARSRLRLIEERGFHRDRRLVQDLEELVRRFGR